ncbi:MAG: roadblock/LC7 domain-containing protein [Myxococcales bacterium]|jgi:predicted regulator of Ras-like GTPase activity (Roadblock/LC7/MglB family)|nr:roadblock/LC7 domain-containing protein [Myxococcales bacterium]
MLNASLVMHEEDYRLVLAVIQKLVRDAGAKAVFVVDRNGQLIAEAGEIQGVDTTSLASLTAGSVAATSGLARLIGEDDFPIHFHQGQRDNLHINIVAGRLILVVVFDERSSLGLVRLRVKRASGELARVFEEIRKKSELGQRRRAAGQRQAAPSPFADITDDDIDNLFSD